MKSRLAATLDVKLLGTVKTFIGWDIRQSADGIKVDLRSYVKKMLERHRLNRANETVVPLPVSADVGPAKLHEDVLDSDEHAECRALVGGLRYLGVCTRPDISKSISVLAQQLHKRTARHRALLKRILRYAGGTSTMGVFYARGKPLTPQSLRACVDADWGDAMRRDGLLLGL